MGDHQGNQEPEEHAEAKWYHHKPNKLIKAISALVIYGVFIFADAYGFFDDHRFIAILAGVTASVALLYYELFSEEVISFRTFVILSVLTCVGGAALYFYAGEKQIHDVIVTGTLIPGDLPTPPNRCDTAPPMPNGEVVGPDALKILMGDNTYLYTHQEHELPAIQIGACQVLSMTRKGKDISVNIKLYSADGKLIAFTQNGKTVVISGSNSHPDNNGDLTQLIIKDNDGSEILSVHYLNPTTVAVQGIFGCPNHQAVTLQQGKPIEGTMLSDSCMRNSQLIIH